MSARGFRGDGASVGFGEAIRRGLGRSTVYGRASRSEFWYFWLFCAIANLCSTLVLGVLLDLAMVDTAIGTILSLFQTVVFIRRLHDVGRSGWWGLLSFTIIGLLPLFVWSIRKGEPARNRFDLVRDGGQAPSGSVALAIDRVEQLDRLRRDGAITEDEYRTLKRADYHDSAANRRIVDKMYPSQILSRLSGRLAFYSARLPF